MCGIAGLAGALNPQEAETLTRRMCGAMIHRGPDDEGYFSRPGFGMGMRRLAIVDVAMGRQPMHTPAGTSIVLNGEIYNHDSLRQQLQARGRAFHTRSDTEVIPHLYEEEGLSAFTKLDGMFAFCLYDAEKQEFLLVRDGLGIKPLYYGWANDQFYFASELKAILAALPEKPEINKEAIHHFLTFRFVPPEQCIWKGFHKLPAGHYLRFSLKTGRHEVTRWWGVRFLSRPGSAEPQDAKTFANLFEGSVQRQLESSDVPVGVMLSGGLDSSAVSAAAVKLGHQNFHTFSVGFEEGGEFNELYFARSVSRHIGSKHHDLTLNHKDFLRLFPKAMWHLDEPVADLAAIPLLALSELAAQEVKVVLSGEGSDELFAGYDLEQQAARWETLRGLDQIPDLMKKALGKLPTGKTDPLMRLGMAGLKGYLSATLSHMTRYFSQEEKQSLWMEPPHTAQTSEELLQSWYLNTQSPEPLDQMQEVLCHGWLIEDLLMKADKMSMAASLELRVPFLSPGLAEFAGSLSAAWKVGTKKTGFVSKRILREYATHTLPEEILKRPKLGFSVPVYQWLSGPLKEWSQTFLLEEATFLPRYFQMEKIKRLLHQAHQGDPAAAQRVWLFLVLEQWGRVNFA